MTDRPVRAGVIGVGYLGRFHAQKYVRTPGVELAWVADPDPARAAAAAAETGVRAVSDYRTVLGEVDAVSIAAPTALHYPIGRECLAAGLDVLLEKPVTETVAQADELISLARERDRVFMVGHLERFNPAIVKLAELGVRPAFIVAERRGGFKPRAANIDVVLDLMIHDLDIILSIVRSPIRRVSAVGVPVLSPKIDLADARIEFENGAVASLTASRVSLGEPVRKIRLFQHQSYISIDYQTQKMAVFTLGAGDPEDPMSRIKIEEVRLEPRDTLAEEVRAFVHCVRTRETPAAGGPEGRRALAAALAVLEGIRATPRAEDLE
jgi:predicted dehydrogenase